VTLLISVAAAVGGTVSFSLLFGVPTKYYPYCGLIGGAGWAVYSILIQSSTAPGAALFATIVVILLSRLFAVRERCPVPGAGVYWTAYYIVTNELDKASQTGYMALKVAVAIVLGIVFVFELPQGIFRVFSKKEEKQGNPRSR